MPRAEAALPYWVPLSLRPRKQVSVLPGAMKVDIRIMPYIKESLEFLRDTVFLNRFRNIFTEVGLTLVSCPYGRVADIPGEATARPPDEPGPSSYWFFVPVYTPLSICSHSPRQHLGILRKPAFCHAA